MSKVKKLFKVVSSVVMVFALLLSGISVLGAVITGQMESASIYQIADTCGNCTQIKNLVSPEHKYGLIKISGTGAGMVEINGKALNNNNNVNFVTYSTSGSLFKAGVLYVAGYQNGNKCANNCCIKPVKLYGCNEKCNIAELKMAVYPSRAGPYLISGQVC